MLKIAFASDDRTRVNLHFGGAERFVVYDVSPGRADLVGEAEFRPARQKGENAERRTDDEPPPPEDPDAPPEDKVAVKLEFLHDCAAVYAASIGASGIRRLMAAGIQPIIVDKGHDIEDLLNEVSLALVHGGLGWVTRAAKRAGKAGAAAAKDGVSHRLLTEV